MLQEHEFSGDNCKLGDKLAEIRARITRALEAVADGEPGFAYELLADLDADLEAGFGDDDRDDHDVPGRGARM